MFAKKNFQKSRKSKNAVTLIEVMIVISLVGIFLIFVLPGYSYTIEKRRSQRAFANLGSIHTAANIFRASTGSYLAGNLANVEVINTNLSLRIIDDAFDYDYTGTATTFDATAARTNGAYTWQVDEALLNLESNPWCSAGTCPD